MSTKTILNQAFKAVATSVRTGRYLSPLLSKRVALATAGALIAIRYIWQVYCELNNFTPLRDFIPPRPIVFKKDSSASDRVSDRVLDRISCRPLEQPSPAIHVQELDSIRRVITEVRNRWRAPPPLNPRKLELTPYSPPPQPIKKREVLLLTDYPMNEYPLPDDIWKRGRFLDKRIQFNLETVRQHFRYPGVGTEKKFTLLAPPKGIHGCRCLRRKRFAQSAEKAAQTWSTFKALGPVRKTTGVISKIATVILKPRDLTVKWLTQQSYKVYKGAQFLLTRNLEMSEDHWVTEISYARSPDEVQKVLAEKAAYHLTKASIRRMRDFFLLMLLDFLKREPPNEIPQDISELLAGAQTEGQTGKIYYHFALHLNKILKHETPEIPRDQTAFDYLLRAYSSATDLDQTYQEVFINLYEKLATPICSWSQRMIYEQMASRFIVGPLFDTCTLLAASHLIIPHMGEALAGKVAIQTSHIQNLTYYLDKLNTTASYGGWAYIASQPISGASSIIARYCGRRSQASNILKTLTQSAAKEPLLAIQGQIATATGTDLASVKAATSMAISCLLETYFTYAQSAGVPTSRIEAILSDQRKISRKLNRALMGIKLATRGINHLSGVSHAEARYPKEIRSLPPLRPFRAAPVQQQASRLQRWTRRSETLQALERQYSHEHQVAMAQWREEKQAYHARKRALEQVNSDREAKRRKFDLAATGKYIGPKIEQLRMREQFNRAIPPEAHKARAILESDIRERTIVRREQVWILTMALQAIMMLGIYHIIQSYIYSDEAI